MREVVIIDGVRTPIGGYGGALSGVRPDDLLALTYGALVSRTGVDPESLDDVYAGCSNQAGEDNRNVARMATLLAGFPSSVPGVTVNRLCSSALESVNLAAKTIIAGEGDICIGSGVESMSRAPWSVPKPERTPSTKPPVMYDTTVGWRYNNPKMDARYPIISMGQTAEALAADMNISRGDQDAFALESQRRAVSAINAGRFNDEIVPVEVPRRRGGPLTVDTDEYPRSRQVNGHTSRSTRAWSDWQSCGLRSRRAARSPPVIRAALTMARRRCCSRVASAPTNLDCALWCAGSVPPWPAWTRA